MSKIQMFQIAQIVIANEVKQSPEIATSSRIAGFLAMTTLDVRILDCSPRKAGVSNLDIRISNF